jgi:hypothetical protein
MPKRSTKTDSKASKQLRKKAKAKKPLTHAQLKKKVDEWFSKYIRYRASDKHGEAECYTCGKRDHVRNLQAGHFASRRYMATRWHDPEDGHGNVQVQCIACNLYEQGRQWTFGRRLDEAVKGRAESIMQAAGRKRTYGVAELRQMVDHYREEATKQMAEKRGIAERKAKAATDRRSKKRTLEADVHRVLQRDEHEQT